MKRLFLFLFMLVASASWAMPKGQQPPEFSLSWKSDAVTKHWLFEKGAKFSGPSRLAPLAAVKKNELEEHFEDCTKQILSIWSKYHEFQGWMALQGTQCLNYQLKFSTVQNPKLYQSWWRHLVKQDHALLFGPWTNDLVRAWNELSQNIMKSTKLPIKVRAEVAETWRTYVDNLNRSDRQDLYKIIVEDLESNGNSDWAQAVAVREGLIKSPESTQTATPTPVSSKKSGDSASKIVSEEEEFYQKFLETTKQSQLTGATELAVLLLDKYPNGARAATVQEKLFQAYFALWDSNPSPEQKAQLERSLDTAKLLHSSRLIEWSKLAHRKADFQGAYILGKQALLNEEKSVDGASLLFIIGRSAYFMGKYREAIEYFDRLIQRHSGYSDFWEAKFRKAMALVRLGEDSKAEEALAEMWLAPENKTYSLSSLYWLIRLKQKRKANVDEWMAAMQERFALTYYGLRLSAEANHQKVSLQVESSPITIKQNWILTPAEKQQWKNVQDLAMAGWYTAAQGELNNMVLNGGPEQKFLWAQQQIQVFAFPQALRIMNELTDLEPRWRKGTFLKTVFPKPLEHIVQMEAQKNELSPLLVYSLIRQESAFLLGATSRSQAKGLMQLIPPTANEVAQDLRIKNFDSDQMYHPVTNLKFGIYYLSKVIRQFNGNVSVGLAAYNAGPQRLKKFFEARTEVENTALLSQEDPWSDLWIEELPWLETNLYVKSILRNRVIYQILEQGTFDWPAPVWKDLFLGTKKVSRAGKDSGQQWKR